MNDPSAIDDSIGRLQLESIVVVMACWFHVVAANCCTTKGGQQKMESGARAPVSSEL